MNSHDHCWWHWTFSFWTFNQSVSIATFATINATDWLVSIASLLNLTLTKLAWEGGPWPTQSFVVGNYKIFKSVIA